MENHSQKRKNEFSAPLTKRVKLDDLKDEEIEAKGRNDLDFRCFLQEPQISFDITIANKTCEFSSHKNILMKISSVFQNLLEGDKEVKILRLDDLNDTNLKILQKLIYVDPDERKDVLKELNRDVENILNLLLLASKYGVNLVDSHLLEYLKGIHCNTGRQLARLWNALKQHNLSVHAQIVARKHSFPTRSNPIFDSLEGTPIAILIQMGKYSRIGRESFTKLMKYAVYLSFMNEETDEIKKFKATLIHHIQTFGGNSEYAFELVMKDTMSSLLK
jgi:hypothetical protein